MFVFTLVAGRAGVHMAPTAAELNLRMDFSELLYFGQYHYPGHEESHR